MTAAAETRARPLKTSSEMTRFTEIIAHAFATTSLTTAFTVELDNTPPPYPSSLIDFDRRKRHFSPFIESAFESGAEAVEAGDWSAIALWEPPGYVGRELANFGSSGPLRTEWKRRVQLAKDKFLYGRQHWHLQFLARNPQKEVVSGSITAVLRPFLERAKEAGVPAWLEATYPRAVAVYEKHGFRLVETIVLGSGKVNALGWPEEGGLGVSGYCMIFEI